MFPSPQRSYEDGQRTTQSGRDLEAAALFKMARMLETACDGIPTSNGRGALNDALRRNQRLWTLFQEELSRPDPGLPADLRVDLLRISAFVDRRTFELITNPDPKKVQALIDINRHIALGLTGSPQPREEETD